MRDAKTIIPAVDGAPLTNWDAATDFVSDPISTPKFDQPFNIKINGWSGVTAGTPTWTISGGNELTDDFVPIKTIAENMDLTIENNRHVFDNISMFKYLKIEYTSGGSTGTFSVNARI